MLGHRGWPFYRRGPLLIEWSLGIFPTSTSKQAPEVWYAFRTGSSGSLSRPPFLQLRSWDFWLMSPPIACLSQTPPLTTPQPITSQGQHLPPHPHIPCSIYHSPPLSFAARSARLSWCLPRDLLQLPVSSLHTQTVCLYQSLAIGLTLLLFFWCFVSRKSAILNMYTLAFFSLAFSSIHETRAPIVYYII